jgi:hypothetical protein
MEGSPRQHWISSSHRLGAGVDVRSPWSSRSNGSGRGPVDDAAALLTMVPTYSVVLGMVYAARNS